MNIAVFSPMQLMRDGLAACLAHRPDITVCAVVNDLAALREVLSATDINVALIDATQGIDLDEVELLSAVYPKVALVALGPFEQCQKLSGNGRTVFAGCVLRHATIDVLCTSLRKTVEESCTRHEENTAGSPTHSRSDDAPLTEAQAPPHLPGHRGCWLLRWARGRFVQSC